MACFLCFAIFAITALLSYIVYQQNYWKRRGIPHIEPIFLKGNMAEWRKTKHMSSIFAETYEKFKDFHNFDERGGFHNEVDDPLTGNLFFMDGDKWRQLRGKLSPTFTSGKMKHMFELVLNVGQEMVSVFENTSGSNLEVTDLLARYTADVIGTCAFGLECNSLRNPAAEFVKMGKRFMLETRHNKIVDSWIRSNPRLARKLHMRVIPQEVHDFYLRIVKDTVAYREKNDIKRNDLMDTLIELKNKGSGEGLTIEEVAAQAFVFFIAGYETSSATMGFALYELAQHPEIQDKVRHEIRAVLEKHKQKFTYECMKEMDYLKMVISETLRKNPIASHLVRLARARYQTTNPKYYIEKGHLVIIPTLAIHYDPEYWPEPDKFIPERFTTDKIQKRPACTWLPFGDGPRNCIGLRFAKMQVSIGLAHLLKNFRFSICPETQIPLKIGIMGFTFRAENGIHLRVEKI